MAAKKKAKKSGRKVLVIDRSLWLRGEGSQHSRLLRKRDDKMCCLGFYLESCGTERKAMVEKSAPWQLGVNLAPEARWLRGTTGDNSRDASNLIDTNDDTEMPADLREERIVHLFAKQGISVEFDDGGSPKRCSE